MTMHAWPTAINAGAGSFYIREELNEMLEHLGALLIGNDSIIYAWAQLLLVW